jgi:hypothetical protein
MGKQRKGFGIAKSKTAPFQTLIMAVLQIPPRSAIKT